MKKDLYVRYYSTNRCNFSCDYCSRLLNVNDDIYRYGDIIDIDNLIYNLQDYNIKEFTFLGGEPSIYEHFLYLLKCVLKLNCNITIYANGSNIDFYKNLLPYKDMIKLIISCHLKYIDYYINNLSFILNNFMVDFNILLDKRYFNNIDIILKYIKKYNLVYITDPLTNNISNNKFTDIESVSKICRKYNYDINSIINKKIKLSDKKCICNTIIIKPSGYIEYPSCFNKKIKSDFNFYKDIHYKHQYMTINCDRTTHNIGLKYNDCYHMNTSFIDI